MISTKAEPTTTPSALSAIAAACSGVRMPKPTQTGKCVWFLMRAIFSAENIARIKNHTHLPVCVGFGIRTPEQAAAMADSADGVVVGSALVDIIAETADNRSDTVNQVLALASALAEGVNRN